MKFAIDLDNVLVRLNTSWIKKVSRELGYSYTVYDNLHWDLSDFPKDFQKRSLELFNDPKFMGNLPPYEGTADILMKWYCECHNLTIITARNPILKDMTLKLINREFPLISKVFVIGWNNNKESFLRDGKYDVLIDDNPMCIDAAIKVEIPNIFMVSNNETRYNIAYIERFKKYGVKIVESILEVEIDS
jgi:5'(3')-deoxyribonucleotidase